MEIKNAATVHRIWSSLDDAELLAACQYEQDAQAFCEASIKRQPEGTILVWVSHYTGKMHIVRREPEVIAKASEAQS
jgi:hypothetical protein